ncbi:MAG: methyl-accepting chemotaxis sensory transducer, partial [Caulobacteraceae bacterium]|nr:methyl-accepting chemotaxis sensory transducer [Caulobacteraceae bacterium]
MRFTIKLKLGLTFALMIALLAAATAFGLAGLDSLNRSFDMVMSGPVAHMAGAQDLDATFLRIARAERDMILADTKAEATPLAADIARERQHFQELLQKSQASASAEARPKWVALSSVGDRYLAVDDRLRELAMNNEDAAAKTLSNGEGRQAYNEASRLLDDLLQMETASAKTISDKVDADDAGTRRLLLIMAAASLLAALGAAVWISLSISKGLLRAGQAVAAVADGDLTRTTEITTRDEIGDLLGHVNLMVERLRGVVADAISASENVSSGSQELSAT